MKEALFMFFVLLSFHLAAEDIDTWSSPPDTLSATGVNSSDPRLGIDASGNVVAVWVENGAIKANAKLASGSWGTSVTLASSGSSPRIAVDSSGNAVALWVASGVVNAATKTFGNSWSSATALSGASASAPSIAVKPSSGDAVAVWLESGVVKSKTKLFGQSWSILADTLSATSSDSPYVAIGANGTVVAIWHTVTAVSLIDTIYSSTKLISGLWSIANNISDLAVNGVFPKVAVDANGNAIAVWFKYNLSGSIYSNVVLQASMLPSSGTGWSTPVDVSHPGARNPADLTAAIGFTGVGNAIAIWTTSFNGQVYNIQSSVLDVGSSWTEPADLAIDLYSHSVALAVSSAGDAFALYTISDSGSIVIQTAESDVGGKREEFWAGLANLSTATANNSPRIAAVVSGGVNNHVTAMWIAFDGSNNLIQSSTGTGTLLTSPTNVAVTQGVTHFGTFDEYFNTVTWTASTDSRTSGYIIYRNGQFIDGVDSFTTQYVDHNRVQNGAVTYGIAANDSGDSQSPTVNVSFP